MIKMQLIEGKKSQRHLRTGSWQEIVAQKTHEKKVLYANYKVNLQYYAVGKLMINFESCIVG